LNWRITALQAVSTYLPHITYSYLFLLKRIVIASTLILTYPKIPVYCSHRLEIGLEQYIWKFDS